MGKEWTNSELIDYRKKHFLPTAVLYHKEPLQLVKASDVHVWDNEGNQYLDAIGGIVCISAGHNHPKVKAEMLKMLEADEIQHTSLLYLTKHTVEAAEKLLSHAPKDIDRISFTNSGSEANELAFIAARQATGENTIVHLRHGYHGGTSGALAACGQSTWRFANQPVTSMTSAMEPYCYRCPFGKTPNSCDIECADNVETTIQTSTSGKIAGFIAEPVMGVGGFIAPPTEYFERVSKIVHNYGGLYISDEVQTGAGRCGENLYLTKTLDIDADMITMAKGLGNGAAVGATLMKSKVAGKMAGKFYFNTFGGDPYQAMQAKVTVEIIESESMIENAGAMGEILMDGLKDLKSKHSLIGDVRGRGLLVGVELVKDHDSKAHATEECALVMDECKSQGLLLGKGGIKGNVLRITPPLSVNKDHIHFILETMDKSFASVNKRLPSG